MEAPVRVNHHFDQTQLLRTIELNLSQAEETLKTLKKPDGDKEDARLAYNAETGKFMPRNGFVGLWSKDHTPQAVRYGLLVLNAAVFRVYRDIQALPGSPDFQQIRLSFSERLTRLIQLVNNQGRSSIELMAETYAKRDNDSETVQVIQYRSEQIFRCLSASFARLAGVQYGETVDPVEKPLTEIPAKINACVAQLVEKAEDNAALLKSVQYRVNDFIAIPGGLIARCIADKSEKNRSGADKIPLKKAIELANNRLRYFEHCSVLVAAADRRWISIQAQCFADKSYLALGASTPTSERSVDDSINHLVNIKAQIDEADGHFAVTCGVINTERKANEFILSLEQQLRVRVKNGQPMKLRIVLHQLNSFRTGEEKFVYDQNYYAQFIEDYFKRRTQDLEYCKDLHIQATREPIVSHINLALNGAAKLGYLEDSFSHIQNMDGLAAQCLWLLHDYSHLEIFKTPGVQLVIETLTKIRKRVAELKKEEFASRLPSNEQLETLNDLNDSLFEAMKILDCMDKALELPVTEEDFEIVTTAAQRKNSQLNPAEIGLVKFRIKILMKMFGMQVLAEAPLINLKLNRPLAREYFKLPELQRMEEIELHLLNDMAARAITEINCKSGLDRTGLARAIWDALRTMYHQFHREYRAEYADNPGMAVHAALSAVSKMVLQQQKLILELDVMMAEIIRDQKITFAKELKQVSENQKLKVDIAELLKAKIAAKYPDNSLEFKELMNAFNYQNLIGVNIFKVAQIVTMESTGIPGMKWGKDYGFADLGANPFPPKRLPRYVMSEGQLIQLVNENNHLTEIGVQLLIRWGNLRGE